QEQRGRHRRPLPPAGRTAREGGDAAATLLAKLGAQVSLGAKVTSIDSAIGWGDGFLVRLAQGGEIAADAVVLAVPHEKAAPLIPPDALAPATVAGWAGLGASPIVNVHV